MQENVPEIPHPALAWQGLFPREYICAAYESSSERNKSTERGQQVKRGHGVQPREHGVVRGPGEGPLTQAERMNKEKRGMVWRLRRKKSRLTTLAKKSPSPFRE